MPRRFAPPDSDTTLIGSIKDRVKAMTDVERRDLVATLKEKAAKIAEGSYGEEDYPGQNALWQADLLGAAGRIEIIGHEDEAAAFCDADQCGFDALTQGEAEEIEAVLP